MSPEVPHQVVTADVPSAERPHSLRQDDCFGLYNEIGDIDAEARTEAGLYRAGVRHLSRFTLTVAGLRPLLLAASPRDDNVLLSVNLTNPDVRGEGGRIVLPRGTLHITRSRFIWAGVFHEMIRVRNFALSTIAVELVVRFGCDFENIIDVRAQRRVDAGRARFERVERDSVTLGYLGADEIVRETVVDCHTTPDAISQDSLRYRLQIGSRGEKTIALAVGCRSASQPVQISTYTRSLSAAEELARTEGRPTCLVESSGARFNEWLQRSTADIGMMLTVTPHGRIPAAGLPWLDAAFGRDAIIVALQTLWMWPDIARNVLRYLAATQSTDNFAASGAEPGKILNEARGGDIPPNYFGVDTTPLFVLLAGAYYARTADLDFIGELWPAITQALSWIDVYGDVDGDGFVEARPRSQARHNSAGNPRSNRCSMRTAASPRVRWRCAKCRATCTARNSVRRASHARWARCPAPSRWWSRRRSCRRASTMPSGAPTSKHSRWRWMATRSPAGYAPPTRGIACSRVLPMPSAAAR